MKRENLAILIGVTAFIFWIAQNQYFGWNKEAESALEGFCDALSLFGYFLAFLVKPVSNKTEYTFNGNPNVKIVKLKD